MDSKDIIIADLTGGLNDTDSPTDLLPGQCTVVENVEFHCASRQDYASLGTRRAGTAVVTNPISASDSIILLHRHLPTTDFTEAELWAFSRNVGSGAITANYKDTTWKTASFVDGTNNATAYYMKALTLHGKLFIAYKGVNDRLHVRDAGSSSIRRVGLAEPAAPSVAETGVGTFSGIRYYRVRYTVQSGGVTLRRSEPSDVTTYNPADFGSNGLSARITKPASISESETHWEVEASLDNNLFYRIATVVVGTTTYDDSVAYSTGYASTGTLSEDVGDYTPLHSARFMVADDDRIIIGGSWENQAMSSRIAWSPVFNDPGVGNDERSPVDTDNFIDLDTYEGGELTDLSRTVNGYIFAFKIDKIYQLTRTGQRARAYTAHTLSKDRGAIEGSVVSGLDQNGNPCVYFIDPKVGPCRIGEGGIQTCGRDIRKTWQRFNTEAAIPVRSIFYPESSQVHWWISVDAGNSPNICIVLHVNKSRQMPDGIRRGWSLFSGDRCAAISTCLFSSNINDGTPRNLVLKPIIGRYQGGIQICDTGTTDSGVSYIAKIRSGPVALNLLTKFGITAASLVAKAAAGVSVVMKLIRDFGIETKSYTVNLSPVSTEDPVIEQVDQANISECYALQVEFTDSGSGSWALHALALGRREEE